MSMYGKSALSLIDQPAPEKVQAHVAPPSLSSEPLPLSVPGLGPWRPPAASLTTDGSNPLPQATQEPIASAPMLLSNRHRMNPKALVINLITPSEDPGLNNHRASQIKRWTGPGVVINLVIDEKTRQLALNLSGTEFMNSQWGISLAEKGYDTRLGYTLLSNDKSRLSKNALSQLIGLVVEKSSDPRWTLQRREIFVNSHITSGIFEGLSGFTNGVVRLQDISRFLVKTGVAGRGTDIVFTGCILPAYIKLFLPQITALAAQSGVTIHFPQMPQHTGRLHNMLAIGPDGILKSSKYNGR